MENYPLTNSMMKPLTEPMDPYQLSVIMLGGNEKWAEFMLPYKFTERECAIKILYRQDTAHYYRKMLRAGVLGKEFKKTKPATTFGESMDTGAKVYQKAFA
jgi:hypothetical protein